jgi:hypothetical protein
MNRTPSPQVIEQIASQLRNHPETMSEGKLEHGWQELRGKLDRHQRAASPRPVFRWFALVAVGAAAAVAVYATTRGGPAEKPLHYVVEGGVLGPNELVATTAPTRLRFSDNSQLDVASDSRISVLATDARGAHIALASGSMEVFVQPRSNPPSSWRFDAGPFSVRVKGTSFHLGYDPSSGHFDLRMQTGVVEVVSQPEKRTLILHAGESIELNASGKALVASPPTVVPKAPSDSSGEGTTARLPAEAVAGSDTPSPARHAARSQRGPAGRLALRSPGDGEPTWSEWIAKGDFAAVVTDAERKGLDSTLARASAADLTALADAARYTRRYPTARQALLALRARFAGTPRAKDAAFFLGRLAEVSPASPDAACTWYDTYLSEAGQGAYAAEAMGRELAISSRSQRTQAKSLAKTYLERFPQGAQAELARSVLGSPTE